MHMRTSFSQLFANPLVVRIYVFTMIAGFLNGIPDVIFNFYLLGLGYGSEVTGEMASLVRVSGFVFGIPIGIAVDRIGSVRTLQIGAAANILVWAVLLLAPNILVLQIAYFCSGTFFTIATVAGITALSGIGSIADRAQLVGFNFTIITVMGFVGSLVAGFLPAQIAPLLGVGPTDVSAYRATLAILVIASAVALLPLVGLSKKISIFHSDRGVQGDDEHSVPLSKVVVMTIGYFVVGCAGGILHPFLNVYFRDAYTLPDATIGVLVATFTLLMGVGGVLGGRLVTRFGVRTVVVVAGILCLPFCLGLLSTQMIIAIAGYFVVCLLIGMVFPYMDMMLFQAVATRQRGVVKSISTMAWSIGWAIAAYGSGQIQAQGNWQLLIVLSACGYAGCGLAFGLIPFKAVTIRATGNS
jgi:MFS family permease